MTSQVAEEALLSIFVTRPETLDTLELTGARVELLDAGADTD